MKEVVRVGEAVGHLDQKIASVFAEKVGHVAAEVIVPVEIKLAERDRFSMLAPAGIRYQVQGVSEDSEAMHPGTGDAMAGRIREMTA